MSDESIWQKSAKPTGILYGLFLKLVAVSCFYFGLRYWGMLIGYTNSGLGRFDLLSTHWRTAGPLLAVVYPIAALGLWGGVSWGVVLWVVAAGSEILMHSVWIYRFGPDDLVITMHLMVASLFAVFTILMWYQRRVTSRVVTVGLL